MASQQKSAPISPFDGCLVCICIYCVKPHWQRFSFSRGSGPSVLARLCDRGFLSPCVGGLLPLWRVRIQQEAQMESLAARQRRFCLTSRCSASLARLRVTFKPRSQTSSQMHKMGFWRQESKGFSDRRHLIRVQIHF